MAKAGGARDQGSRVPNKGQEPPRCRAQTPPPRLRPGSQRRRSVAAGAALGTQVSPHAQRGGSAGPREKQAQPHGSPAVQRLRPPPRGRARPSRPSSWRRSRAPTTRRPSRRATCESSCRRRPAWTCASCRSAPRAAAPPRSRPPAPRLLTGTLSPGLVPKPPGQGKEAQEGRGPAALGPVLPEREAGPRRRQAGQGQRAGGGAGQRRRGLLRR